MSLSHLLNKREASRAKLEQVDGQIKRWIARHLGEHPGLTNREQEVFCLIGLKRSNKEIASELGVRVRTVKFHARNVLHKFKVSNRNDLPAARGH